MAIRWTNAVPDPLPVLADWQGPPEIGVDPVAEAEVLAHLRARDVEQGGLLIGRAWLTADGAVARVQVTRAVAAEDATGSAFALRMETSVWSAARRSLEAGELIVGWYHSHPGLTAFFSETDRQTQAAFFNHSYSLGWVIDPVIGEEALFLGPGCLPAAREIPPPDPRPDHDPAAS